MGLRTSFITSSSDRSGSMLITFLPLVCIGCSALLSPVLTRGFFCGLLIFLLNGTQVHSRLRGLDLESFKGVHDNPGHREVAKPLAVGGDDVPGRSLGAAPGQGFLISLGVSVPELALLVVGVADLPVPLRVVEPPFEAPQLLFLTDVQEELEDARI